jgi:hypothetical protein
VNLAEVYLDLRDALAPLGIEVGSDVLALWRDRERHGYQPLPPDALRRLAQLAARLAPGPAP